MVEAFAKDLDTDVVKSVERAKDIFKVPATEVHRQVLRRVTLSKTAEPFFHMQFGIFLIKEKNMLEGAKLNKGEKELELEILDYMHRFISDPACVELLMKAS